MKSDKTTTFSIIAFIIVLLYGYIFYLVYSRAEQQHFNAFEVVTGLSGLIISIVTIYFVFNTYDVQLKQIAQQKGQIEDNKKDVEFNRALDMVFRQLEITGNNIKEFKEKNYRTIHYPKGSKIIRYYDEFKQIASYSTSYDSKHIGEHYHFSPVN